MISSRLTDALTNASKMELRAETAINDGKYPHAITVLSDLQSLATSHLQRVKGLVRSLEEQNYNVTFLQELMEKFDKYKSYAKRRIQELTTD